jgi:hypothetical protein
VDHHASLTHPELQGNHHPVARLARLHGRLGRGPGTTPTRKSGCRIEYLGDDWGFALCDPATETYEPAVLPGGQLSGGAVEAYDAAAAVHLTEYGE